MAGEGPDSEPGADRPLLGAADRRLRPASPCVPSRCAPLRETPLVGILRSLLGYARARDYEGWDHRDGPNSVARRLVPVRSRTLDRALRVAVEASPIEVRPYLGVFPRRTPVGSALFVLSNLACRDLLASLDLTADVDLAGEARSLARSLLVEDVPDAEGFCVGHDHRRDPDGRVFGPETPSVEATALAVRALTTGERSVPRWPARYVAAARSARRFVVEDLDYRDVADGAVVDSTPGSDEPAPPDVLGLSGRLLLDLYDLDDDGDCRRRAEALLDHAASHQHPSGGWRLDGRRPMPARRVGRLVGAFLRHRAVTGSDRYAGVIPPALSFYRESAFGADGAPNWSSTRRYPRDVRAGARGVLTFAAAGALDDAEHVLGWTLSNLYHAGERDDGDGEGDRARVYRRIGRVFTDRTTLMEWGQAWTCYAVAEYLRRASERAAVPDERLP